MARYDKQPDKEFEERTIQVNRISKKTKGGNKIRFATLVAVGDRKGRVGIGLAKAADVASAIQKANKYAVNHLITLPMRGTTIPHEVRLKWGAARIIIKPAPEGSGVIAGGPVRAVMEVAGIKDVVAKILGTSNKATNVYAIFAALKMLKNRQPVIASEAKQSKKQEVATATS